MAAVNNVPLPPHIKCDGNLGTNWAKFKQVWDSYELITGLKEKDDSIRVATFVTVIGPEALDIHNILPFKSDADRNKIKVVLDLWEAHCKGKINVIFERYQFNTCFQRSDSFEAFLARLRTLSATCAYGGATNEYIRDRLVAGLSDVNIIRKLLSIDDLTLDRAVTICRSAEATEAQLKIMSQNFSVNYVDKRFRKKDSHKSTNFTDNCKFCGGKHEMNIRKCPAYGQECTKCNGVGHYAKMCRTKSRKSKKYDKKYRSSNPAHVVDTATTDDSDTDSLSDDSDAYSEINHVDEVDVNTCTTSSAHSDKLWHLSRLRVDK